MKNEQKLVQEKDTELASQQRAAAHNGGVAERSGDKAAGQAVSGRGSMAMVGPLPVF